MAYVITDKCVACGSCIGEGDIYVIDADKCLHCGACAGACPNDAIIEG